MERALGTNIMIMQRAVYVLLMLSILPSLKFKKLFNIIQIKKNNEESKRIGSIILNPIFKIKVKWKEKKRSKK